VYAFTGEHPAATPTPGETGTPAGTETGAPPATETATPVVAQATETAPATPAATGTPARLAQHGDFHAGAWVRVNAGAGDCLNARAQPSMSTQSKVVNVCLPDGYGGYLSGSAIQQDGHWWWMLAGSGWVAEDYLVYVRDVSLQDALAPRLAGFGRIAFQRGPDIWVMDADGGGQRLLVAGDRMAWPYGLAWSPDGMRLSYSTPGGQRAGVPGVMDLHVIDLAGGEVLLVNDAAGGAWSPDGARISIVQGAAPPEMGGGWLGVPGWVEVATGAVHLVGEEKFYQQDPPAWSHDGTRLLLTHERYEADVAEKSIRIIDLAGNEIARIDEPQDVYYSRPQWSPDGTRIAFHVSDRGKPRNAVYDVAAGRIVAEAAVPEADPNIGGRCGSADMWLVAWSRDGRDVLYSYGDGLAGTNGVWVWDVASGGQRLTPALGAGPATAGPGGLFAFAASSYGGEMIFAGNTAGGMPMLITDGRAPVWSPN
jgi:Tol biopolymer transport system component